jgi:6-phosphogluconolactonase
VSGTPVSAPAPEVRIHVSADAGAASYEASDIFRREVESSIWVRGRAAAAFSGGKSPRPFLERLGGAGFARWAGWKVLHVFWVDERAVPASAEESNYRLLREALLDRAPLPLGQVHRLRGDAADLDAEAARYARALAGWARGGVPRLDLVHLGLGPDGHVASLFPGSAALGETSRWVVSAEAPPPHPRRLTLTLPVINAARAVIFYVTGADKAEVVARVLEGDEPVERLPARGVRPCGGRVHWVLDRAAAARLSPGLADR